MINNELIIQKCFGITHFKDGVYQPKTETYRELGEYWESLDPDCKWGGRWGDGNHMSYAPKELFGGRR